MPVTEPAYPPPTDITQMLHRAGSGDGVARDALFELVYRELRGLARSKLARESPLTMLNPTSLVHESWFRLVGHLDVDAPNRRIFFGYASKVELRYFGGFTVNECAEHLEISAMTVARDWEKARLFLSYQLTD